MKILKRCCHTFRVILYLANVLFHGLKYDSLLEEDICPNFQAFWILVYSTGILVMILLFTISVKILVDEGINVVYP
jgi:hypothetical protein